MNNCLSLYYLITGIDEIQLVINQGLLHNSHETHFTLDASKYVCKNYKNSYRCLQTCSGVHFRL